MTIDVQIESATRLVMKAVSVSERANDKEFSEHLRIGFSDLISEIDEALTIVCAAFRSTESGELVRGYVYLNDVPSPVMIESLSTALQPYLISRSDLVFKQDAEGFKICRRDAR